MREEKRQKNLVIVPIKLVMRVDKETLGIQAFCGLSA